MCEDVSLAIMQCLVCFKTKTSPKESRPPLNLFQEGILMGRWCIDYCGKFPASSGGYRWILIAVETFSCRPVAIPIKTQTTLEAAQKVIEHVFLVYGCPLPTQFTVTEDGHLRPNY